MPPRFGTPYRIRRDSREEQGWALTLADMMTLLLCFFVLLLTMASIDTEKYEAMSDVMAEAMGGRNAPSKRMGKDGSVQLPVDEREQNLFALQLALSRLLSAETEVVDLKLEDRAVSIRLKGRVLFGLGSADLTPQAERILGEIAPVLADTDYDFTVEGHTDDLPIHSGTYPSNWELSSARASAVARFLINGGVRKDRIRVLGLADTRPLAPNRDADGDPIPANQARNRRIVILVHPPA